MEQEVKGLSAGKNARRGFPCFAGNRDLDCCLVFTPPMLELGNPLVGLSSGIVRGSRFFAVVKVFFDLDDWYWGGLVLVLLVCREINRFIHM